MYPLKTEEIEKVRESVAIIRQALIEIEHARRNGPNWYTKGDDGMYQQVGMWLQRGIEAVENIEGVMPSEPR